VRSRKRLRPPHPHIPRRLRPAANQATLLWHVFDHRIRVRPKNYLFQSGLATVSLILILLVEDAVFRAAIVVAVASTAFTIFVFPDSVASTPRRVIGGHLAAVIAGALISALTMVPIVDSAAQDSRFVADVAAALAVGLGTLLMVSTNTEHPPAAGTAFGLVIYPWSWSAVVFIMSSAVVLSIVRVVLRNKLVNLL